MTEKKKPDPAPQEQAAPTEAQAPEGSSNALAATVAEAEAAIMEMIAELRAPHRQGFFDQRLVSIAATQFELGFLALFKAMTLAMNSEQKVEG